MRSVVNGMVSGDASAGPYDAHSLSLLLFEVLLFNFTKHHPLNQHGFYINNQAVSFISRRVLQLGRKSTANKP